VEVGFQKRHLEKNLIFVVEIAKEYDIGYTNKDSKIILLIF
jgi:hypothetical protein